MISFAAHNHITAVRALWKEVFQDSEAFLDLYFQQTFQANQCVVSVENDQLCGAMQLLPYTFQYNGQQHNVIYIFAIMTRPDKRKQGHMSRMLSFAFEELKNQDIAFAFLMPQEPELFSMYEKYGFTPAFQQTKRKINLPVLLKEAIVPDINEAYEFYLSVNKDANKVLQSKQQFEFNSLSLQLEGGELLGVKEKSQLQSICFVLPTDNSLRVLDLISFDDEASRNLLGALKNKYQTETAWVSSSHTSTKSNIGMVKFFSPQYLQFDVVENSYLSLMMSE
jgi:predicted acetyltransferase